MEWIRYYIYNYFSREMVQFENNFTFVRIWPYFLLLYSVGASLVVQTVKNLPAMQETWVQSLGWEDPLEKEMATHSSILAWKIPWTEVPGGLQSIGLQSQTQLSKFHFHCYIAIQQFTIF